MRQLAWALVALLVACSKDEPPPIVADEWVLPLEKQSLDSTVIATLTDANPAPPALGNNTWTLQLADAEGNPLEGLDLKARLYMPKHGHGSSPTMVHAGDVAGEYVIERMNFFMGGVWEVTLYADSLTTDQDVVFLPNIPD